MQLIMPQTNVIAPDRIMFRKALPARVTFVTDSAAEAACVYVSVKSLFGIIGGILTVSVVSFGMF